MFFGVEPDPREGAERSGAGSTKDRVPFRCEQCASVSNRSRLGIATRFSSAPLRGSTANREASPLPDSPLRMTQKNAKCKMQNAKCEYGMGKRLLVCVQTVILNNKTHSFASTIHRVTSRESFQGKWPLKTCGSYSAVSAGTKKFLP